ncbi:unnamed protein product [Moneuplotes crassus]|uniref:Uncharacterized protein n=1 Tax=Euplotes crassus TaxID=5936 RepID=A0AAD1UAF6_EUPCR|nr:unnamed protein product [Moneuplotes crassus]
MDSKYLKSTLRLSENDEDKENYMHPLPEGILKHITETKHNKRYFKTFGSEDTSNESQLIDKKYSYRSNPFLEVINTNTSTVEVQKVHESFDSMKSSSSVVCNVKENDSSYTKTHKLHQNVMSLVQIPKIDHNLMASSMGGKRARMHYLSKYRSQEKVPKKIEQIYTPRRDSAASMYKAVKQKPNKPARKLTTETEQKGYVRRTKTLFFNQTRKDWVSKVAHDNPSSKRNDQEWPLSFEREKLYETYTQCNEKLSLDELQEEPSCIEPIWKKERRTLEPTTQKSNTKHEPELINKTNKMSKLAQIYDYESKPVFEANPMNNASKYGSLKTDASTAKSETHVLKEISNSYRAKRGFRATPISLKSQDNDLEIIPETNSCSGLRENSLTFDPSFIDKKEFNYKPRNYPPNEYDCETDNETCIDVPTMEFIGWQFPNDMSSPKLMSVVESDPEDMSILYPSSKTQPGARMLESTVEAFKGVINKDIEISHTSDIGDSIYMSKNIVRNGQVMNQMPSSSTSRQEDKENQIVI